MKQKIIQTLVISMCASLATIVSLYAGITPVRIAHASTTRSVVTYDSVLFKKDGTMNGKLAWEFVKLAELTEKVTVNEGNEDEYRASNSGHIRKANNKATVPNVRLFESIHTTPHSTENPWTNLEWFATQRWRLAYISYPKEGETQTKKDPVFTFWMSGGYRRARFTNNSNNSWSNYGHNYNNTVDNEVAFNGSPGSPLRNTLIGDFDTLLNTHFSHARQHIVTPSELPGSWQASQPEPHITNRGNSLTVERLEDYIFIPSVYEVGFGHPNNPGGNIWDVSQSELEFAFNANTVDPSYHQAWLRSHSINGETVRNGHSINMSSPALPTITTHTWTSHSIVSACNLVVRPAIHISLGSVAEWIEDRPGLDFSHVCSTAGTKTTICTDCGGVVTNVGSGSGGGNSSVNAIVISVAASVIAVLSLGYTLISQGKLKKLTAKLKKQKSTAESSIPSPG